MCQGSYTTIVPQTATHVYTPGVNSYGGNVNGNQRFLVSRFARHVCRLDCVVEQDHDPWGYESCS